MPSIDASARSFAPPDRVWPLLAHQAEWTRWGAWTDGGVEGEGDLAPGVVRWLFKKPWRVRERVTDWEPGARFGYELLDGMKVEGYRAVVTLEPDGEGGTHVRWHADFERAGFVTRTVLRLALRDASRRVAKAASR